METEDCSNINHNLLIQPRAAKALKTLRKEGTLACRLRTRIQIYQIIMENQNPQEKKSWGGKRAGAGRPNVKNNTRTVGIRIPDDVAAILDRQPNRSAYIIEAIREYDRQQRKRTILGIEISYTKGEVAD